MVKELTEHKHKRTMLSHGFDTLTKVWTVTARNRAGDVSHWPRGDQHCPSSHEGRQRSWEVDFVSSKKAKMGLSAGPRGLT